MPDHEPLTLFELELTDGPAHRLHERALGPIDDAYPWESLRAEDYPAALVERARLGWTENAFNEYATAVAMGQLLVAFGQARVPLIFRQGRGHRMLTIAIACLR